MGYNIKQKIEICLKAEANPDMTQGDLAQWAMHQYGSPKAPSQTTISRILSSKNELIASKAADFSLVRRRKQSNPLLRRILTEWITQALWENIPITTPIIQSTAHAIWTRLPPEEKDGNGVFNQKWCNHFLKKLNANLRGDDSDIMSNPSQLPLNKIWKLDEKLELKSYLKRLIEVENYSPQDIFTLDEFQLFYSLPLDQIFDVSSIDKGLKQSSSSTENSVTIMLGTNIDGTEKLTPLIVGKYDKFDVSESSQNLFKNLSYHHHGHHYNNNNNKNGNSTAGSANTNNNSSSASNNGANTKSSQDNSNAAYNHTIMNKITEVYNIYYKSNANKWITSSMFQNYLLALEHKLAGNSPNRKILIILDDSSSHRIINLKFSNIRLCYLKNESNHKNPYHTSSFNGSRFDYLPMSFGIVEEFKILYRLQQYLEMINIQRNMAKKSKLLRDRNSKMSTSILPGEPISAAEDSSLNMPLTSSSISNYKPDSSSTSTLSESDYNIPLIRVIEWIKRSWDSISSERIFLSWKKTKLFDLNPRNWPALNSQVVSNAYNILDPLLAKASVYNSNRSYEKLDEIMGYLNVVIPWKADELLGLVNESGKVTLSYVSIEEIIGSCLSESYDKEREKLLSQESENSMGNGNGDINDGSQALDANDMTGSVSSGVGLLTSNDLNLADWGNTPVEDDNQFDMSYSQFAPPNNGDGAGNVANSMNINSLLVSTLPSPIYNSNSAANALFASGNTPGPFSPPTKVTDKGNNKNRVNPATYNRQNAQGLYSGGGPLASPSGISLSPAAAGAMPLETSTTSQSTLPPLLSTYAISNNFVANSNKLSNASNSNKNNNNGINYNDNITISANDRALTNPPNYNNWYADKRRKVQQPYGLNSTAPVTQNPSFLNDTAYSYRSTMNEDASGVAPLFGNTPTTVPSTRGRAGPGGDIGSGSRGTGGSIMSPSTSNVAPATNALGGKDEELINSLTKLLDASNSGTGLKLSSTTLAELRNSLNDVKSRSSERPHQFS